MAIYKKLALIQAQVKGLGKNQKAFNYDYVTGDKLLSVVRPLMDTYHLLLMPEVVDIQTTPIAYDTFDRYSKTTTTKTEVLAVVKMRMNWVDSEDGEVISQEWAATGMNGFDKGYGSALTYGERYYLLKLFHLQTDKDDVDYLATTRDEDIQKAAPKARPAVKKNLTGKMFTTLANKEAEGKVADDGVTPRQYLLEHYNVNADQLKAFDDAVAEIKAQQ